MEPYIGEIRMFGGDFAPLDWAFCDGRLISIAENDALFNLIGTTYGGDGIETFALPNLMGRVPIHQGQSPGMSNYVLGEMGGVENVTLTLDQIPAHNHLFDVSTIAATASNPSQSLLGNGTANLFIRDTVTDQMNANSVAHAGGNQPHENMMPYLGINFIIALYGVWPQQPS